MTLNEEQTKQLSEAARPLMKFLNENCNPHCTVLVETNTVELVTGVCKRTNNEFVTD